MMMSEIVARKYTDSYQICLDIISFGLHSYTDKRRYPHKVFSYFSTKTYVVGTY